MGPKRRAAAARPSSFAAAAVSRADAVPMSEVRVFPLESSSSRDICDYYRRYQVVVLRTSLGATLSGADVHRALWPKHEDMIRATFSHESTPVNQRAAVTPVAVYGGVKMPTGTWYCSFIAQPLMDLPSAKERTASAKAVQHFTENLPVPDVFRLMSPPSTSGLEYTVPVWVFLGRVGGKESAPLAGRVEHTDSVTHDGTWHLQTQGAKTWQLRPAESDEWGAKGAAPRLSASLARGFTDSIPRLTVTCNAGDIIIVNTRLWWHHTEILPSANGECSMSYARDFYHPAWSVSGRGFLDAEARRKAVEEDQTTPGMKGMGAGGMPAQQFTNVDSLYATHPIKKGTIVLTEDDMPDCELMRAPKPNCEVAETEDGTMVLIAIRPIAVGDFFTVAPSSSDDDDSD